MPGLFALVSSATMAFLVAVTLQGCFGNEKKQDEVVVECYSAKAGGRASYWKGHMKSNGKVELGSPSTAPAEGEALLAMQLYSDCDRYTSVTLAMRKHAICMDPQRDLVGGSNVTGLVAKTETGKAKEPSDEHSSEFVLLIEPGAKPIQDSQFMEVTAINDGDCRPGMAPLGSLFPNTLVKGPGEGLKNTYAAYMDNPLDAKATKAFIFRPIFDHFPKHTGSMAKLLTAVRKTDEVIQNWHSVHVSDVVVPITDQSGSSLLQHQLAQEDDESSQAYAN